MSETTASFTWPKVKCCLEKGGLCRIHFSWNVQWRYIILCFLRFESCAGTQNTNPLKLCGSNYWWIKFWYWFASAPLYLFTHHPLAVQNRKQIWCQDKTRPRLWFLDESVDMLQVRLHTEDPANTIYLSWPTCCEKYELYQLGDTVI